jgi:hypothetical protein
VKRGPFGPEKHIVAPQRGVFFAELSDTLSNEWLILLGQPRLGEWIVGRFGIDVATARPALIAHLILCQRCADCRRDWCDATQQKQLGMTWIFNWSLNPFRYADRIVREAFVSVVCAGFLVVASLAGCTVPLSQPEMSQAFARGPDPLISPPTSLQR